MPELETFVLAFMASDLEIPEPERTVKIEQLYRLLNELDMALTQAGLL